MQASEHVPVVLSYRCTASSVGVLPYIGDCGDDRVCFWLHRGIMELLCFGEIVGTSVFMAILTMRLFGYFGERHWCVGVCTPLTIENSASKFSRYGTLLFHEPPQRHPLLVP
jgi:hypothetical protein